MAEPFRLFEWIGNERPIAYARSGDFIGKGWVKIVEALKEALPATHKIIIVKEKFGELRISTKGDICSPNEDLAPAKAVAIALVDFAEHISSFTCERCGCPGKLHVVDTGGGFRWLKTICGRCCAELDQIPGVGGKPYVQP